MIKEFSFYTENAFKKSDRNLSLSTSNVFNYIPITFRLTKKQKQIQMWIYSTCFGDPYTVACKLFYINHPEQFCPLSKSRHYSMRPAKTNDVSRVLFGQAFWIDTHKNSFFYYTAYSTNPNPSRWICRLPKKKEKAKTQRRAHLLIRFDKTLSIHCNKWADQQTSK